MSASSSIREHEVAFCGDIKSWADALFARHPEWPFLRAAIEQLTDRLRQANERFATLAASRTGNAEMQEKTAALLLHWHIHGRG